MKWLKTLTSVLFVSVFLTTSAQTKTELKYRIAQLEKALYESYACIDSMDSENRALRTQIGEIRRLVDGIMFIRHNRKPSKVPLSTIYEDNPNTNNNSYISRPTYRSTTPPARSTMRCQAITKKGTQCLRNAQPGSRYCWQHQ